MPVFERWMAEAITLAGQAGEKGEVPVGAVVVLDNEIVGRGFNETIGLNDPSAHAEIQALRDAALKLGNYRLPGSTLFVTVEPCTMCAGALIHARVGTLVFGAREPRAGAVCSTAQVLSNPALNHTVEVIEGVSTEECGTLMTDFFRERRSR
jgi:tRNA(adenine34) deaminase